MFDGLVERYDLLNRLMTFGLDRRWRIQAVASLGAKRGDRILDLGCGTGDLLRLLARSNGPPAGDRGQSAGDGGQSSSGADGRPKPVGIDVSALMLGRARQRLGSRASLVRGSAFELPFAGGSFQGVVSGFVLRNLRDLEAAMAELARVIVPGGRIALLDATEPAGWVRPAFDVWFRVAAPALGALAGKRAAYQYLSRSLVQIPPAAEMCRLLEAAGFEECTAQRLTFGAVTLFTARRG